MQVFTFHFKEFNMHPTLHRFIRQYFNVVCAALVPVVLTAFLSVPVSLGGHPDASPVAAAQGDRHMS